MVETNLKVQARVSRGNVEFCRIEDKNGIIEDKPLIIVDTPLIIEDKTLVIVDTPCKIADKHINHS
ncbi:hypothetical protein M3607_17165 [Metabacillus litoralis]|nr:hypothetical protein [Metabacillus litoralis]MCM3413454.1 hypothetical protein [Metabacillus litoralis]